MKTKQFIRLIFCAGMAALLVVGCESPLATLASPTFTQTAVSSSTPPAPTATSTFSPTPSPTEIHIPTQTPSLAPTLSTDEREAFVRELLLTNAGCKLPCWWGISPGNTSWEDAQQFLVSIGARFGSDLDPDGSIFHGTGGFDFEKLGIYNRIAFLERNGIVEWIKIEAESYSNPSEFLVAWGAYAPEKVIAQYGPPSRVWVQSFSEVHEGTPTRIAYTFWLFYDDRGFLIRYGGSVEYNPIYRFCPTVAGGNIGPRIELYLQAPESERQLEELVGEKAGLPDSIMPLDKAAGLSVEEYYALYLQTSQPICFDTPREIWP